MSGYDFTNVKIMLCDDCHQIRSLVKSCLFAFGVKEVVEASNTDDGYDVLRDAKPDLMITDWNMPPTSGLDLVRRIRLDPDSPNPFLPIIMLTGYSEFDRVLEARDAGVSAFLAKPVSASSLLKRLTTLVEDNRSYIRSKEFFGPDRRFNEAGNVAGPERRGEATAA